MRSDQVNILGAGLVGSLLAALLARRGFEIKVFEKRHDPRKAKIAEGRSINLALSDRGIKALRMAGAYEPLLENLIPMKGRMMHDVACTQSFLPYGTSGQCIYSVSRSGLNRLLIDVAEGAGASFLFDHRCESVDLKSMTANFRINEQIRNASSNVLIGADGAFSALRNTFLQQDRFSFEQHYIDYGYKELSIQPEGNEFALEPNYLHIWPRKKFMLIALPNPDRSFTCTLFLPFNGEISFSSLKNESQVRQFFEAQFPDALGLIPDLMEQFDANPTSSLVTIKSAPWVYHNCLLIGDAAHAIVPFYGQGMNAGFEDCQLFMEWGERMKFDWGKLLPYFSENRKRDADAIAELALKNFVEMRDKVADQRFLDIKKVEARLHETYPDSWIPLYSMVTFSEMPYSEALYRGKIQEKIMNDLPDSFDPYTVDLKPIMERFNAAARGAQ